MVVKVHCGTVLRGRICRRVKFASHQTVPQCTLTTSRPGIPRNLKVANMGQLSVSHQTLSGNTALETTRVWTCAVKKHKNTKKSQKLSGTNQKPEPWRPFGTGLVRHCPQGLSRRSLLFFVPYFSARLDFLLPPLSAPGSPRMQKTWKWSQIKPTDASKVVWPN